jgi:hypothetical protein
MLDNLERVIICNKCKIKRITFSGEKRGPNGKLIPLNFGTLDIHKCDQSESFPCKTCNEQIYLDNKVLSPTGKRIPLSSIDGRPHDCPTSIAAGISWNKT